MNKQETQLTLDSIVKNKYKFEISIIEITDKGFLIKQLKVSDMYGKYIKFGKLNESLLMHIKQAGVLSIKK